MRRELLRGPQLLWAIRRTRRMMRRSTPPYASKSTAACRTSYPVPIVLESSTLQVRMSRIRMIRVDQSVSDFGARAASENSGERDGNLKSASHGLFTQRDFVPMEDITRSALCQPHNNHHQFSPSTSTVVSDTARGHDVRLRNGRLSKEPD